MVLEIAQVDVKPGQEAEFEAGVAKAAPLFKRAKGCKSLSLQRSVEKPSRYRLFIGWDTVENHTVDFRGSADFQEWRKLVGALLRLAARGRACARGGEGVLTARRKSVVSWDGPDLRRCIDSEIEHGSRRHSTSPSPRAGHSPR